MATVHLDPTARRDLAALPASVETRIVDALERLAHIGTGDVKPIQGRPGVFRLRVGGFRVLFRKPDGASIVVARVIDRRDLDRTIARRR